MYTEVSDVETQCEQVIQILHSMYSTYNTVYSHESIENKCYTYVYKQKT